VVDFINPCPAFGCCYVTKESESVRVRYGRRTKEEKEEEGKKDHEKVKPETLSH